MLFSTKVALAGIPEVSVYNGTNVIRLAIQNETQHIIKRLTISSAGTEALPNWIKFPEMSFPLANELGDNQVNLLIHLVNAPDNDFTEIPLLLIDDLGRRWQVTIGLRLNAIPTQTVLKQNIPNPFNPNTTIEYHLANPKPQRTTLIIYNTLGQRVRILVDASQPAGVYRVQWNGKDDRGKNVASGAYLYKLTSGMSTARHQMLLLK